MVNRFEELEQGLVKERTSLRRHSGKDRTLPAEQSWRRARALGKSLSYDVPGVVPVLRQPKSMACWATVTTMLMSWRDRRSTAIESAMGSIGKRWLDAYNANTGLFPHDEEAYLRDAGLEAMRGFNPSIEGWESLLLQYGPLWITTDEQPGPGWSIHARILTGIHGDGTAAGTRLKLIDPAGGRQYEETIARFYPKFEEEVARTGNMRYQILHWPVGGPAGGQAGAGSSSASRSLARASSRSALSAAAGAQPWAAYFHFDKGTRYKVDGPAGYDGQGEVLERSDTLLRFTLDLPAYTVPIVGTKIPKSHVILEFNYAKEGAGNLVKATVNGSAYTDTNAKITSDDGLKRRTIRPSIKIPGFNLEWVAFSPDGADEIDLDIKLDGGEHDFDLERQAGSSGKSLALGEVARPWSRYFPFTSGTEFEVDGPLNYNGTGKVHQRTDALLEFELNMPATRVLGEHVPKSDLLLEIEYKQEGPGNRLKVTANGKSYEDQNLTVRSEDDEGRRSLFPAIKIPEVELGKIVLAAFKNTKDRALLTAELKGSKREFELRKTKGGTALALGGDPGRRPPAAPPPSGPPPTWTHYFHFPKGTRFRVDGPLTFNGSGEVLELKDDVLRFKVDMSGFGEAVFEVTYKNEGKGNLVRALVGGVQYEDKDAAIYSDPQARRRKVQPQISIPGHTLQELSVAPDGADEIDLDVTVDGSSYDFDLER